MRRCGCWWVALLAASLASAWGQPNARGPHIGYIYPAGGRQGTTFRVTVGGQLLGASDQIFISGPAVRAAVVEYVRPISQAELGDVAWFLNELVRRRWSLNVMRAAAAAEDVRTLPDHPWLRDLDHKSFGELVRLRNNLFDPKKQPNAQLADQVEIAVTIDPKAAPGDRELRLATPTGLTNPLCFQVGVLPEVREEQVADPAPVSVELPVLLNGQIMPGEVDRFHLRAHQGQQLVIRMQARRLIPYLADAVPGWFQATMSLYDPQGREVAYDDDYRFDPDPVIFYKVPADGVYGLEVRDAIYRGRDDFVYRIAAGELPFITQVFPLGGREGSSTVATIAGWNLPTDKLPLDTQPGGAAIRQARLNEGQGLGNEVPYVVGTLPEITETEPNDATGEAQPVTLPVIVNGRIGRPGDVDAFRFDGRAGEEVVAEVYARRLNSPLDSLLRLVDATEHVVASDDDHADPEMGLLTHQADSYLRFRLTQDGTYRVILLDAQQQGSGAYGYRLRIGPPQPDFALRLTPSGTSLAPGRAVALTVRAVRKDGFAGDIDVVLSDGPAGFTLTNAKIPADKDSVEMTLGAPRDATREAVALQFEGRAQIGGVQVSRPVVPAEDMMQAFAYRQLVPQQEFLVAIAGSSARLVPAVWRPLVPGIQLAGAAPAQIPQGGTAQVQLQAPPTLPDRLHSPLQTLRFELANRPRGVTLVGATVTPAGVTLIFRADAIIAQVGDAANLIVEASAVPGGQAEAQRVPLGVLPAIPFQIVRP